MGITARQWVAEAYGGPEVLRLREAELPDPGQGEVVIEVRAAGVNPVDFKRLAGGDPAALPLVTGYEVAGVIAAIGPGTEIASGGGAVGDAVLAFRVSGGYATALTVPAADVFAKPANLDFPQAANLLLAGATAAEMLHEVRVGEGDTVVLHGGSGAVGLSLLQQARPLGARVIATASLGRFDAIRAYGGEPVAYGDGLADRIRALAPGGIDAALDAVGTDEAVDVSLELVADRDRIVTIAAAPRANADGFRWIGGLRPESSVFRAHARAGLIDLAARGELEVPVARTFPFEDAPVALKLLLSGHPGGKLALLP